MEQINQGAAVKAQAASHRDGFLQSTSVPKVPRNHLSPIIPAATSAQKTLERSMEPLYQKLAWEKRVKETALKGAASTEKLQRN